MPENPLLPDAELRALHARLKQAAKPATAGREALLAATLGQLQPNDLLFTTAPLPKTLLPQSVAAPQLPPNLPFLALAAAAAAALSTTQPRPLALALLASNQSSPNWPEALTWAHTQRLPLILAIADPSGSNALRPEKTKAKPKPTTLSWTALSQLAQKLQLPILTVDGEDAVAVYRVMAESILRARSGDGPAILWSVLPTPRELAAGRPPSATPLRRLQRFLRVRNITLENLPEKHPTPHDRIH